MKTRRLITLCALLGTLVACSVSANDAPKPNPGNTSLGNTTVGGYVDSSVEWSSPAGRVTTVKPPTLTITAPKTGAKWSNAVYTVTGTVTKGSAGVTNVFVSVGADGWNSFAVISNKTWLAQVDLTVGTNTIAAYAVDTNGVPSKTNTVKLVYIVTAPLTFSIVGEGKVSPDYSNALLVIGDHYTMKATAAKGFGFYYWDVGDSMSNSTSLSFTMVSNLVIIANFKDITPPTLTITAPISGEKYSNSLIEVTGTASDNVGVTNVWVQINGGGWVLASGTNNWSAADLPVVTGNNTVDAVAVDAAGNYSKTNEVSFTGIAIPPPQTTWAPTTISGSVITMMPIVPVPGVPHYACFGSSTFSYADTNELNDSGIGDYDYQFVDTNYSVVQVAFSPPSTNGTANIDLAFTDFNIGYYTNYFGTEAPEIGTFTINPAAQLVPASLTGKTFTIQPVNASRSSTVSFTATTVTIKESAGTIPNGKYSVDVVSPTSEFVPLSFVEGANSGTIYVQLTYLTATGGIYEVNDFLNGVFEKYDRGTFTFK